MTGGSIKEYLPAKSSCPLSWLLARDRANPLLKSGNHIMAETTMEVNLCPSTNIGKASCSVHTENNNKNTEIEAVTHPRNLIPDLCRQFYDLGWVTGTGGGITIKYGDEIYIAPSGVQKERILVPYFLD
ncbi:hypothetical protein QZH41_006398 [Actinostola sp. cb2023]|nr:hypothetical protein QZH41_006398 [Actinostola sp. cb2023]